MADANYCTEDEVMNWLSVTDSGLTEVLTSVIPAASRWVDGKCGRRPGAFVVPTEATARYYDASSDGVVWTDDFTTNDDFELATDSGDGTYTTVWAEADYQLLPLNAAADGVAYDRIRSTGLGSSFTRSCTRTGLVRVTALWGWPAVPDGIKQATIMQAARLAHRRNSPNGVAGANDFGIVRVSATDADIAEQYAPFVRVMVG